MKSRPVLISCVVGAIVVCVCVKYSTLEKFDSFKINRAPTETPKPHLSNRAKVLKSYGNLPLAFEKNEGQTRARVKFLAHGPGYTFSLGVNEAVIALNSEAAEQSFSNAGTNVGRDNNRQVSRGEDSEQAATEVTLRMRLIGANANARIRGLGELGGKTNYLIGNDPRAWHTNIPNYARVKCSDVYDGVNLVYYGNNHQLEYDFVVAPHTSPTAIRFKVDELSASGATSPLRLRISQDGSLIAAVNRNKVLFHKPIAYQMDRLASKHFVDARYVLGRNHRVRLRVASYDRTEPLVIDPVLSYSTYLGPSGGIYAIAVDSSGNAYVTGGNNRTGFPTTPGAFETTCTGGCSSGGAAFVSKLNSAGSALVYSTYLAPSDGGGAFGEDIAVDSAGVAYVAGQTGSGNFPTTPGAFQTGCHACSGGNGNYQTGFVAKLDSTGSALVYSTYLGGSTRDIASGIALDASDNAYVTGITQSSDFPVTPGCFQPTYAANSETYDFDSFVTELNSTGSALVYSTFLGSGSTGGGH